MENTFFGEPETLDALDPGVSEILNRTKDCGMEEQIAQIENELVIARKDVAQKESALRIALASRDTRETLSECALFFDNRIHQERN